jgi:hypothetical protein
MENPEHQVVRENQKEKIEMQNDSATANEKSKCKNQR